MSTQREKDEQSLKKRQRLLDNNRQKYQQDAQNQMAKQTESIQALKKENEKLKQELAATTGGSYSFSEQDRLSNLQAEIDALERKLQFERMRRADIEKKVSMARVDMMRTRRGMGGVNVTTDNTQLVEKQVKVLENRLDQALVKFNEALSYNKDLRQQIDSLRDERKVFKRIYQKLEAELHEKKKRMADKIERANQDYEERDRLQQELEAVKQAAKEDSKRYEEHFQALEAMMQQYKAAREQQQQQQLLQQQAKQQETLKSQKSGSVGGATAGAVGAGGGGGNGKADSPDKKSKSRGGQDHNDGSLNGHGHLSDTQREEHDLQEMVDQLKEATGIQDLDVLYQKFVKAEEQNFSLYNFVNELNAQAELLEAEIGQLREQLHSEKGDVQRRKVLKELENELAATELQYEKLTERTEGLKKSLGEARAVCQEIFTKIGCSTEMSQDLLGTTECTDSNMIQFLGIIEHRTNELICARDLADATKSRNKAAYDDEEERKNRERRTAERQAAIEAGEILPDEDEDEGRDEQPRDVPLDQQGLPKFGVAPKPKSNETSAQSIIKSKFVLPQTNASEQQADADDIEDDVILSYEQLRQKAEAMANKARIQTEPNARNARESKGKNSKGTSSKKK